MGAGKHVQCLVYWLVAECTGVLLGNDSAPYLPAAVPISTVRSTELHRPSSGSFFAEARGGIDVVEIEAFVAGNTAGLVVVCVQAVRDVYGSADEFVGVRVIV